MQLKLCLHVIYLLSGYYLTLAIILVNSQILLIHYLNISYLKFIHYICKTTIITILFRTAAPFARITQPSLGSLRGAHNFRIVMDETKGAINVTNLQGIIYVSNATILRKYNRSTRYITFTCQYG